MKNSEYFQLSRSWIRVFVIFRVVTWFAFSPATLAVTTFSFTNLLLANPSLRVNLIRLTRIIDLSRAIFKLGFWVGSFKSRSCQNTARFNVSLNVFKYFATLSKSQTFDILNVV